MKKQKQSNSVTGVLDIARLLLYRQLIISFRWVKWLGKSYQWLYDEFGRGEDPTVMACPCGWYGCVKDLYHGYGGYADAEVDFIEAENSCPQCNAPEEDLTFVTFKKLATGAWYAIRCYLVRLTSEKPRKRRKITLPALLLALSLYGCTSTRTQEAEIWVARNVVTCDTLVTIVVCDTVVVFDIFPINVKTNKRNRLW